VSIVTARLGLDYVDFGLGRCVVQLVLHVVALHVVHAHWLAVALVMSCWGFSLEGVWCRPI